MIELRDIRKTYVTGEHEFHALKGINLSIQPNDYIALMGSSGSGKSTLMNIIGALDTPTSGEYKLRDRNIHELNDDEISEFRNQEIGFVFQTFNLLPKLSAQENVALPLLYANGVELEERNARAKEMLELVGLGDKLSNRPNEMSGGQRQRVAIARALVNRPSLILADEPTGNLDTKNALDIHNLFLKLRDEFGYSFLIVTHNPKLAEMSDQIIKMRDGSLE